MRKQVSSDEKIAFLFPGQGSQYVGMGKDLYNLFKVARETFEEADEALHFKISKLCFEGPWKDLKLTSNTQPAILTVSVSALRVLQSETGLSPTLLAGHSLGEYSALVAGRAIDFVDAVRVVRARGQLIQEAVPVGKGGVGVVLGLNEMALKSICQEEAQKEVITPANYNCPGQIAISGHLGAVRRAISLARKRGAKGACPQEKTAHRKRQMATLRQRRATPVGSRYGLSVARAGHPCPAREGRARRVWLWCRPVGAA